MPRQKPLRAPRGTRDVLPEEQPHWSWVRSHAESLCRLYGYGRIDTPVFEDARVFLRTVGEASDIVEKEVYLFEDRGGDLMALRPEGTANVCRAYLEHGMHARPQPVKLYYLAPIFRYDRPQAGRYRQHHQFGAEAIGEADAAVDAEVIDLLAAFYRAVGLRGFTLHLNSIGDGTCRPAYLERLRAYYSDKLDRVCEGCRQRYQRNPLRLLDCKEPLCQPVIAGAPKILKALCGACARHFSELRSYLDALGIAYTLTPTLVRGLDYYTRTVFEFQPPVEGAQSALGGGGRYDGLMEALGGQPTPGVGFGTGIERIILSLQRDDAPLPPEAPPQVFVAYQTPEARVTALRLAAELRAAGVATTQGLGARSLKAQLRQAHTAGVRHVIILGLRELETGTAVLRSMANGSQEVLPLGTVLERVTRG